MHSKHLWHFQGQAHAAFAGGHAHAVADSHECICAACTTILRQSLILCTPGEAPTGHARRAWLPSRLLVQRCNLRPEGSSAQDCEDRCPSQHRLAACAEERGLGRHESCHHRKVVASTGPLHIMHRPLLHVAERQRQIITSPSS